MSVVIIGGNECMECRYREICKKNGYKAKVFTKEKELDSYLQEKKADVLMIREEAYAYDAGRTGSR